jgi:hypothetical protein
VDGSVPEMPCSDEIKEKFGVNTIRKDGKETYMGRILTVYDTINNITLYGALESNKKSENEMFRESLGSLQLDKNDILVFDRLFASYFLFFYLDKIGVQFCFRMKNNWWREVRNFNASGKESSVVTLRLPAKDKEEAKKYGITAKTIRCRLTKIKLESGETEILLSSLVNEDIYSVLDTKIIYGLRWPIEDSYKTLKHKVCIENFSGKSYKAVMQDFYAKIFIMNLTAVAVHPVNEALKKKPKSKRQKHTHQVNIIEAIMTMKRAVVSFFLTDQIENGLKRLYERISKITEPIRHGRKYKRNHQPKRKYYMNYKPV